MFDLIFLKSIKLQISYFVLEIDYSENRLFHRLDELRCEISFQYKFCMYSLHISDLKYREVPIN